MPTVPLPSGFTGRCRVAAMTNFQALLRMHALESWRRVPLAKDGRTYGPGWFGAHDWQ